MSEQTRTHLKQLQQLETISELSSEQAKQQLIDAMLSEARHDAAKNIKRIEDEAHEVADKKAKMIMALAIQRYAGDFVAEKTVSVVPLPSDEMKGRIIGREGRNIRAIEPATGMDLMIDENPETFVCYSSKSYFRRLNDTNELIWNFVSQWDINGKI